MLHDGGQTVLATRK